MRYEVIITPTYTTKADVEMSIMLDISKFDVTVSSSNVLDNGSGSYTVTIPKNTIGMDGNSKFHTGIFLTPKDETTSKEDAIVYGETVIDKTINSDDTKYKYSSKIAVKDYTITYTLSGATHTGEVYATKTYPFNADIVPLEDPVDEEGYTFSGWVNEPSKMPLGNLTINGVYNINSYVLSYIVDDKLVSSSKTLYNAEIVEKEEPTKIGYTFSHWTGFPEDNKMPAHDVTVTGNFAINSYTLTVKLGDEELTSITQEYNSVINFSIDDEIEGYDIIGKENIPSRMPAEDKTVVLTKQIHKHKLSYVVDGTVLSSAMTEYNATITPLADPTKEGYTFSGWSEIPSTMPDEDVTITGKFTPNEYTVYIYVDKALYKSYTQDYGTKIDYSDLEEPSKEGYDFKGWDSEFPDTMPVDGKVINAVFEINTYTITYVIDGVEYTITGKYGDSVTVPELPTKTGYDVSWNKEFPTTIGSSDVTIEAVYTIHKWMLTYIIGEETVQSGLTEYGTPITPYNTDKEGYRFNGWDSTEPETMPDNDVTLTGSYDIRSYNITYFIDNAIYSADTVEYNSEIVPPTYEPVIGKDWSGWSTIPETMPAYDLNISATTRDIEYYIYYKVNGVIDTALTQMYYYDVEITANTAPTIEGYTFDEWENIPTRMPNYDVTVEGIYNINSHTITFKIDGEEYSSITKTYGSDLTDVAPTYEKKTGEEWSGWSTIPATMPDTDLTITSTTSKIEYKITYVIEGSTAGTQMYHYNDTITALTAETRDGYTFAWADLPTKMPNNNLTIEGSYTEVTNTVTVLYGTAINSKVDSYDETKMETVDLTSVDTVQELSIKPISNITEQDWYYSDDDDAGEIAWQKNTKENGYAIMIAYPSSISKVSVASDADFEETYDDFFETGKTFTYNGVEYVMHYWKTTIVVGETTENITLYIKI